MTLKRRVRISGRRGQSAAVVFWAGGVWWRVWHSEDVALDEDGKITEDGILRLRRIQYMDPFAVVVDKERLREPSDTAVQWIMAQYRGDGHRIADYIIDHRRVPDWEMAAQYAQYNLMGGGDRTLRQDISLLWAMIAYNGGKGYSIQLNDGKVVGIKRETEED